MPYRSAQPPKPDCEPEAAAELRRRATRTRLGSAAACLVVPLAISVPGYFFLEELQFKVIGGIAWPLVSMLVGVCLPIGLGCEPPVPGALDPRRRVDPLAR